MQQFDQTPDVLDYLEEIAASIAGEQYEPGGYFTIGGIAGNYLCKSPWNTECEVRIASVTASSATPGAFSISIANPAIPTPTATGASFGASVNGGEMNNQFNGIAGFSGAPIAFEEWLPLGRGAYVYATVTPPASNSILIVLAFRRLLNKYIPNNPKARPSTHNHPTSRRPVRMLHSLSRQMSGYEAQYAGGKYGEYEHSDIPETQDLRGSTIVTHRRTGQR